MTTFLCISAAAYAVSGLAFWSFIRAAGKASNAEHIDAKPRSFGATVMGVSSL